MNIQPIATIHTEFPEKFGIPRQSGLAANLQARIVFEPMYRNPDALRGLEGFSHIWLIGEFSANSHIEGKWQPTVRPPRLGGNGHMGVFATRSPFRPNEIGLSSVKIIGIEYTTDYGPVIHVAGADLMDGTPIFDIKPYIPYCDCHIDATGGFTATAGAYLLEVTDPFNLLSKIPEDKRPGLMGVLSHDPRPSYQEDSDRVYGLNFAGANIRFTIKENTLTITEIHKEEIT